MAHCNILAAAIAIAVAPSTVSAQDSHTRFRLAGMSGNVQACLALEAMPRSLTVISKKQGCK
jgi:hypothetical protein